MKLTKKEIMKNAHKMHKSGFAVIFADCLKASWELAKKVEKVFVDKTQSQEKLNERMHMSDFRKRANGSSTSTNVKYNEEGKTTYTNLTFWTKGKLARVYATEVIDKKEYFQSYVQVKEVM